MKKKLTRYWKFLTNDIWRVTEGEVSSKRFSFYNVVKTIYIAVKRFGEDNLSNKASALTYSTLLAIVPLLAILFAIARGFGFSNIVENQVFQSFGGASETTEAIVGFIDSYLEEAKSGIFVGVGLILLLWTVLNLISRIENTFNDVWQVQKGRSMFRKVTDYFSMFLLMPILLVTSGGISVFMSTVVQQLESFVLLSSLGKFFIRLIPFVLIWFIFAGLYVFMPNTKVKFKYALISGIIVGTAYQVFQYLYISGQIWVTRYNAIYGSFAAVPLFLLWLQMSWTFCLFGVELTYAGQNIRLFSFEEDTRNISRRYRDFICILIMSIIAKRFERNEKPYTAEEISETNHIPIRLTKQVLMQLQKIDLIHEVMTDEKSDDIGYQPSMDINHLNVALLLDRLDTYGSENFKIDKDQEFNEQWNVLIDSRQKYYEDNSEVLLKDL